MNMGESVANLPAHPARAVVTMEATRENPIATVAAGTPEFQNRTIVLFSEETR
jgi:hypothetical protein